MTQSPCQTLAWHRAGAAYVDLKWVKNWDFFMYLPLPQGTRPLPQAEGATFLIVHFLIIFENIKDFIHDI